MAKVMRQSLAMADEGIEYQLRLSYSVQTQDGILQHVTKTKAPSQAGDKWAQACRTSVRNCVMQLEAHTIGSTRANGVLAGTASAKGRPKRLSEPIAYKHAPGENEIPKNVGPCLSPSLVGPVSDRASPKFHT